MAGPRPGSWALTPDQWAGRQPCDCLGSLPLLCLVFIGIGPFSVVGWKSHLPSLSQCPRRPSPPPALTPTPSPSPCLCILSGRKESKVPGSSFCLAPCGWKFTVTPSALPNASAQQRSHHPRVKAPGAPHPRWVPGPHKSLFYIVPWAASGSLAEI